MKKSNVLAALSAAEGRESFVTDGIESAMSQARAAPRGSPLGSAALTPSSSSMVGATVARAVPATER